MPRMKRFQAAPRAPRANCRATLGRIAVAALGFAQQITFLYAADAEACWRFYEEVLGLALVQDQGGVRIYRVAGAAFLGICRAAAPRQVDAPRAEGGVVLTLVTEDVTLWHARLAAAGVAADGPPREDPRIGIRHFFFRDPAGYLLEIQRFLRADSRP